MSCVALLGFDWLRLQWAPALLGVLVVALLVLYGLRARRIERERLVAPRHQQRFFRHFSPNRSRLRAWLAVLALLFAVLALLGPVRGYTLREVRRKGLDLALCMDTSRSMLVEDVRPNRLQRAQREVAGLLDRLEGDRAALLAFSGDVREVAPLTHDRNTLKSFVATISPEDNLRGGTDLGAAIARALELFDGRSGAYEVIVILTDGEDLEGKGLEWAQKARERGIRIYLVGMATAAGGKIPLRGQQGFLRDESGQEVVSTLDGSSLERIAQASDGAYLSIENAPFPLEEIYNKRIARLEGRELEAGKERIPHDRYQWPLVLSAACLLASLGLRERRGTRRTEA